jgi:hypothetical protein
MGVFVFESPYFQDFIDGLEYDTVYHQHLSYLSLKPLVPFLAEHGLEVFDVERTELHGGGFRVFIAHDGQKEVKPSVQEMIDSENFTEQDLMAWGKECAKHKDKLFNVIYTLYSKGKTIACVSAPAKGMTMLNYTGIGRYVSLITEKSRLKIGRYTPGDKLLIQSDEELIKQQPDYAVLLAWNFSKEIIKNNPDYKGTWIIPSKEIKTI